MGLVDNILILQKGLSENVDGQIFEKISIVPFLWLVIMTTIIIWIFGYKVWERRNLSFKVSYDEISQNVSENQISFNYRYRTTLKNEKILRAEIKTITKNFMGITIISNDSRIINIPRQVREYNEIVKELSL